MKRLLSPVVRPSEPPRLEETSVYPKSRRPGSRCQSLPLYFYCTSNRTRTGMWNAGPNSFGFWVETHRALVRNSPYRGIRGVYCDRCFLIRFDHVRRRQERVEHRGLELDVRRARLVEVLNRIRGYR